MAKSDLHSVAFPILEETQVATLATFSTRRSLRDGEFLFRAGDREFKFFVVESGAVEIVEHSSGETKRVAFHERPTAPFCRRRSLARNSHPPRG